VADLALREGQPAGLGLRIHLVVGAVMAFLDIPAKILLKKIKPLHVDIVQPEPTYEWRSDYDDG
jgi:hypothetical protein